ncbi:MAG: hypothetical protein WCW77_02245 [Patescibacteria group bacterium]|jgi:hypothetical protein
MTTILTPNQEREPITKGFLRQELDQRFEEFGKKIDEKTDQRFEEFGKKMFKTFATKEDFKDLPTKDDMFQWKSEILNSVDKLTKSFEDHKEEHDTNLLAHDRFEKRIRKLEGKPVEAVEIA